MTLGLRTWSHNYPFRGVLSTFHILFHVPFRIPHSTIYILPKSKFRWTSLNEIPRFNRSIKNLWLEHCMDEPKGHPRTDKLKQ